METYKNIDEFIELVFPLEYQKIIRQKKSNIDTSIEKFDLEFIEKLETIIKAEPVEGGSH
jgi:hypothetical protein